MAKGLKYVAYYDNGANYAENRYYSLAAADKIDYICSALNRNGIDVEIVSACGTIDRRGYQGKFVQLTEQTSLTLLPTIGRRSKPMRLLKYIAMQLHLFRYLWRHTTQDVPVLAYHSLGYAHTLWLLKKLKRFRLILEVEEIYADVSGHTSERKREMLLFRAADGFLFPSQLLNDSINHSGKPSAIVSGSYQAEEMRKCRHRNLITHVIYAGTFDPRKGGAAASAAAAEFLDENYHMHIIGFGKDCDKENLLGVIAETGKKTTCNVTFDGLLSGEDYVSFIQSCDIGLSTQNPDAVFNATSFPSKVLSYMANGLRVVSIRIPVVEKSAVGDLITYYDEQSPKSIADAIRSVDFSIPYDSRKRIKDLDARFLQDLRQLIEAVSEVN